MIAAIRPTRPSRLSLFTGLFLVLGSLCTSLPGKASGETLNVPRLRFLDADGHERIELIRRQRYQVEIEDSSWNQDPSVNESFEVSLWDPAPEEDYLLATLTVRETGLSTGKFRASFAMISLADSCPFTSIECFEHYEGGVVELRHNRAGGEGMKASATVVLRSLAVVNDEGKAEEEVLEGAAIRIRLIDAWNDTGQIESRVVTIDSDLGDDLETLTLYETTAYSGVFERSLPTLHLPTGGFGSPGDRQLALGADPHAGVVTGETVTLRHVPLFGQPVETSMPVVAARLMVLDRGKTAATVLLGDPPRVLRLENPGLAAAGLSASFEIASGGDIETFINATNLRGVFDLTLPFVSDTFLPGDGVIGIEAGNTVTFRHLLANWHSGELEIVLPVSGTQLRLVDTISGMDLASAPDLRPFKVQWIESGLGTNNGSVETRNVALSTQIAGDLESFELTETAAGSNVFEATIEPRISSGSNHPGVLEVGRRPSGLVGLYDTVTATVAQGTHAPISAVLPLTGPRVAWTNAQGESVTEIFYNSLAHLLVDDPLLDTDPFVAEEVTVVIDEGYPGGPESVVLRETGSHTAIFRGSIPVAFSRPTNATGGNGILEVRPATPTRVIYSMPGSLGSISADVELTYEHLEILGFEGNTNRFYLEGESLWLYLFTRYQGNSPDEIEVEVRSLHWGQDVEKVTLVEWHDTGIYSAVLPTALAPAEHGNGILEIGRGAFPEKILAVGGGARATAELATGFLRFVDWLGREVSTLALGQQLGVEIIRRVDDPAIVDTLLEVIRLTSQHGSGHDEELLTLVETGADTGVFRAFLPTRNELPQIGNGIAEVAHEGATVRAVFDDGVSLLSAELPFHAASFSPPTANPDTLVIAPDTWAEIDAAANDVSGDGSTLTVGAAAGGAFTTAVVYHDGHLGIFAPLGARGSDVVTYLVTDENGLISQGEVHVEIGTAPVVTILEPSDGAVIAGRNILLRASASDVEDGDLSNQIAWISSGHSGVITGSEVTVAFPEGSHEILAMVSDSDGLTASARVAISIVPANIAPTVTITAPSTGLRAAAGDSVGFAAIAVDPESGDLGAGIVWTSNLAGQIGSGPFFSTSGLGVGTHIVTAAVADPSGATGSASVQVTVKVVATSTFVSIGTEDGFVLESSENTGVGGLISTGQLRLGDNLADRQYRSFLSFDTSALPDDALIRSVRVRAQRSGITGTNPATTHGQLTVDVKQGFFGASAALQNDDFAAAATADAVCVMTLATANGQWSSGHFGPAGLAAVNLEGLTQLRLQLALDDDDDAANDFLDHYGGESTVASTRPQLIVEYLP